LAEFTRRLATVPHRASAGATAALTVGLSADLVAQVAARSPEWEEHQGALAQADVVRERAMAHGREIAVAYLRLVEALDEALAAGPERRSARPGDPALGDGLLAAGDLLLEIAENACDCAALAVVVAKAGDPVVRGDATGAAVLAAAAAEIARHLVDINLVAGADPERSARAQQLASVAAASRSEALRMAQ
jgi:hypothetical protein